ncbi:MAG: hypothetical protein IKO20_04820 [Bacteroidaceae bacterium]|nr:hypothetical protein [Bacteroidaceae bacterium]
MRNFTSTFIFFVVGALMGVSSLSSQITHAHSSTQQWKGIDLEAFFDTATENKPIYLYNVGTGKFVIEGGNWGMEARLFYEDFGRQR